MRYAITGKAACRIALCAMLLTLRATAARAAAPDLFSAGFETAADRACPPTGGDQLTCSQSGTWSYVNDGPSARASYINDPALCHSSSWCGKMTTSGAQHNTFWDKAGIPLVSPAKFYTMTWWRFPTTWRWACCSGSAEQKGVIWEGGATRLFLSFLPTDSTHAQVAMRNEAGGPDAYLTYNQAGTEPLLAPDDKWHSVEVEIDQSGNSIRVWFDGKLHIDRSGIPVGDAGIGEWKFGAYQTGNAGPYFLMDDIGVSTTRIGTDSGGAASACDLNGDSLSNVADVQLVVNQAIGAGACATGDINKDSQCNVVDVQRVVNAALGGACVTGP